MAQDETLIEIALSGPFEAGLIDTLPDLAEVDVGLASGFGGERILKFVLKAGPAAVAALKRLLDAALGVDRITNVKITRNGVEIGSLRAADAAAAKELILDVLDRLGGPGSERDPEPKAAKPSAAKRP